MHLLCLGLSHHTAPVELRERLSYAPAALAAALARFGCGREARPTGYTELAILSTCNRLELYAVAHTPDFAGLLDFLSDTSGQPRGMFEPFTTRRVDEAVVAHLCRVAAGLDSMIVGEPQILGQVTDAYEKARTHGAVGRVLATLFQTAIHAGKRARTETGISRHPASASSVAVKLAEAAVPDLRAAQVLVLGAGEMAELAVEALRVRGVAHLTVLNRTRDHAAQLAEKWGAQALPFEQLAPALAAADIVIVSTSAPHPLIYARHAQAALAQRPTRPLVFIDIAVPRNVETAVGQIPNVHCYDIDDLHARLTGYLAERRHEIPQVESIVQHEAAAYGRWWQSLAILPLIADLRAKADTIRRAELEKTLRRLPPLNPTERAHVETHLNALTEALVNKLLHEPTQRLRAEATNGHAAEYAAVARYLFALEQQ